MFDLNQTEICSNEPMWQASIGPGDSLGDRLLPEPMLTKVCDTMCSPKATVS